MSKDKSKKIHVCFIQGVGAQFLTTSMSVAKRWRLANEWNEVYFDFPVINSFKEGLKKSGYSSEQIKNILCQTKMTK